MKDVQGTPPLSCEHGTVGGILQAFARALHGMEPEPEVGEALGGGAVKRDPSSVPVGGNGGLGRDPRKGAPTDSHLGEKFRAGSFLDDWIGRHGGRTVLRHQTVLLRSCSCRRESVPDYHVDDSCSSSDSPGFVCERLQY